MGADATDLFDPRAILTVLERRRVTYVVIGAVARVLHGTEEITDDLDICPRVAPDNAERLAGALEELGVAGASDRAIFESLGEGTITALETPHGRLQLVPSPAGTRHGWGDLRRQANYEAIGDGLRVPVASLDDLLRMAAALDREDQLAVRLQMRSLRELTHDVGMER